MNRAERAFLGTNKLLSAYQRVIWDPLFEPKQMFTDAQVIVLAKGWCALNRRRVNTALEKDIIHTWMERIERRIGRKRCLQEWGDGKWHKRFKVAA